MEKTDIAYYALEKLKSSQIKKVHVIGRRGVLQASFTAKEIREIVALPDVQFVTDNSLVNQIGCAPDFLAKNRSKKRVMDILKTNANLPKPHATKSFILEFLKSPTKILANHETKKITGLELQINRLEGNASDPTTVRCVGTEKTTTIDCDLLVKCIGFQNEPFPEVPFENGVFPNVEGRVYDGRNILPKLYVSGWIKTGPIGVLAATLYDAHETARSIEQDLNNSDSTSIGEFIPESSSWTDFNGWIRINEEEKRLGKLLGKDREKICTQEELERISFRNY